MPTTHTHYVPRPPVDEQPLTPNTLRAAASTLIFGRRPSATRLSTAAQLPENTIQSILEFLDDDALARAMTACRAWHDGACGAAWADKAWRARGDAAGPPPSRATAKRLARASASARQAAERVDQATAALEHIRTLIPWAEEQLAPATRLHGEAQQELRRRLDYPNQSPVSKVLIFV